MEKSRGYGTETVLLHIPLRGDRQPDMRIEGCQNTSKTAFLPPVDIR